MRGHRYSVYSDILHLYIVQGLELVAGAVNLTLMVMNIRDGLTLTGKFRNRGLYKNTIGDK